MWNLLRREGGKMRDRVYLFRNDYPSYYKYRKDIKAHREAGYVIRNVYGGVVCFRYWSEYKVWANQK